MILKELLRRPIAFHRVFVDIAGSVTAALFLSQACYWSEVTEWDWFYKTQQDWEKETGLSRHEQDGARRKLLAIKAIEEVRRGVPARMFYRVNAEILAGLIAENRQTGAVENQQASLPKIGKPYKETESTTETTTKKESIRFVRPTLVEVQDYCQERGNSVDPEAWFDHYTSKGWKVGSTPMKDWQAAVRTWERNSFGNGNGKVKNRHEQQLQQVLSDRQATHEILRRRAQQSQSGGLDCRSTADHVPGDEQAEPVTHDSGDDGAGSRVRIIRRTAS